VIALVSTVLTVAAGLLMTLDDEKNFTAIESGLWWAIQTVITARSRARSSRA
jgi:hypothetical protein